MRLGVNIDHVATIRQARRGHLPDLMRAARICEASGADSIVIHLREDRRHIQDKDVIALRKTVATRLNLEMSIAGQIMDIACMIKPDQSTLVPEKRQELTTEGGLDVYGNTAQVNKAVRRLAKSGIAVSLFIDPDKKQIAASADSGVTMIELHTGRYACATTKTARHAALRQLSIAAAFTRQKNMRVFAGHGLDYENVLGVLGIGQIEELNIGYSIVCRAVMVGLSQAVKEMKDLIQPERNLSL